MTIFFYIFASLLILSSILVVYNKNPIYAMLWLIFGFLNATGLIILLGAEFVAMMFVIVYIGAVAVLFLFIIMMLTTRENDNTLTIANTKSFYYSLIAGILLFLCFLLMIAKSVKSINKLPQNIQLSNVYLIGENLYTKHILPFQTCGLILFSTMIGAIYLVHKKNKTYKKQDIASQLTVNKSNRIKLVNTTNKQGIDDINYEQ